jgi:hypothetical protein
MTTAANDDPLAGWDPRRRAALESLWQAFKDAGGDEVSLSDELIAERRGLVPDLHHGLAHPQDPLVQIDVTPPQTDHLAVPQASHREHFEQDAEPVAGGVVQERAELLWLPWPHLRPAGGLQLGQCRRVRG